MAKTEIMMLPIDKIRPSPFQPRETFDKEKIEELANSIEEDGLLEPILVRKDGDGYQIIAGERRWRACQFKNMKEIPAVIRDPAPDDLETRELSLTENWHRLDLESIEIEKFVWQLYHDGGPDAVDKNGRKNPAKVRYPTIKALADRLHKTYSTIYNLILTHDERDNLTIDSENLSAYDFLTTRVLEAEPELRNQILELRSAKDEVTGKDKLTRDAMSELVKVMKDATEPELQQQIIGLVNEDKKTVAEVKEIIDVVKKAEQPAIKEQVLSLLKDKQLSTADTAEMLEAVKELEPEQQEMLIDMRATGRIKRDEMIDFINVVKKYKDDPALIDSILTVKEQKENEASPSKIEVIADYLAAQPEDRRQEIIEQGIDLKVVEAIPFEIDITPERAKEIHDAIVVGREESEALRNMPESKEKGRLLRNYQDHGLVSSALASIHCPKCNGGSEKLKWTCCDMTIEQAKELAYQKLRAKTQGKKVEHV